MGAKRRAVLLGTVRADLLAIQRYVAEQSGSVATGERFAAGLRAHCNKLAALLTTMGRPRPDMGGDVRSIPFKSYVIFFRYRAERFEVLAIRERHRDMQAFLDPREP